MKKSLFTLSLVLAGVFASAQTYTRISYPISKGFGNTGDRISNVSFIGFHIELGHEIHRNTFFGLESGWITFYDRLPGYVTTLDNNTTTIRGTQYRYYNAIPILAKFTKRWETSENVKLFGAVGAGISYSESRTDVGVFSIVDEAWPVTFEAELGTTIDVGSYSLLTVSAAYNVMLERGDIPMQNYLSLRIGFAWE